MRGDARAYQELSGKRKVPQNPRACISDFIPRFSRLGRRHSGCRKQVSKGKLLSYRDFEVPYRFSVCNLYHRVPDHLVAYLEALLNTSAITLSPSASSSTCITALWKFRVERGAGRSLDHGRSGLSGCRSVGHGQFHALFVFRIREDPALSALLKVVLGRSAVTASADPRPYTPARAHAGCACGKIVVFRRHADMVIQLLVFCSSFGGRSFLLCSGLCRFISGQGFRRLLLGRPDRTSFLLILFSCLHFAENLDVQGFPSFSLGLGIN